jgi:hypothetical protein
MNAPAVRRAADGNYLNPSGKPAGVIAELRERLSPYQAEFVTALVGLVRSSDEAIRLAAIKEYFDRLAGKPSVSIDQSVQRVDHTALYLEALKLSQPADITIDVAPAPVQENETTVPDTEW